MPTSRYSAARRELWSNRFLALVLMGCLLHSYLPRDGIAQRVEARDLLIVATSQVIPSATHDQEQPQAGAATRTEHKPLVSFIIPTKLNRPSLNLTLNSLLKQTDPRWEVIVGVDVTRIKRNKRNKTIKKASQFLQDESHIRYHNVQTKTKFRGRKKNGSAQVRNEIIKQFATADWVAFVDDDDALSPFYVEKLVESINSEPNADIILFRMQGFPNATSVLPPPSVNNLFMGDFGISFAVRRQHFQKGLGFVPHPSEDYFYVRNAHVHGAVVKLSTCILYFVRQEPNPLRPICGLEDKVNVTFSYPGVRSRPVA